MYIINTFNLSTILRYFFKFPKVLYQNEFLTARASKNIEAKDQRNFLEIMGSR